MVIGDVVRRNACNYPRRVGLVCGERSFTWQEMNGRVNRLANALVGLGLERGERLGLVSNNCNQFIETYLAAAKAGLVVVPVNVRLAGPEMSFILNSAGACALVIQAPLVPTVQGFADKLETVRLLIGIGPDHGLELDYDALLEQASDREPGVPVEEADGYILLFTSGTTGQPKGVLLSHRNQAASGFNHLIEFHLESTSMAVSPLPTFFVGGWNGMVLPALLRACPLVIANFEPTAILDALEQHPITHLQLVPTMLQFLVNDASFSRRRYPLLQVTTVAGSPVHPSLLLAARDVLGGTFIIPYGMTETSASGTILRREYVSLEGDGARRLASVGTPMVGMMGRVVDDDGHAVEPGSDRVGEILLRGDPVMSGYWRNPEETANVLQPDGWFHTGDMARIDEDGLIYIVDRKKEMIISGGMNIYSREIEEVLYSHPGVLHAAVIGVPDEKWGEAVKAIIVAKPGTTLTREAIVDFCKERLASFKKPAQVDFVAALPMTSSGKVLKSQLREAHWAGRDRKVN